MRSAQKRRVHSHWCNAWGRDKSSQCLDLVSNLWKARYTGRECNGMPTEPQNTGGAGRSRRLASIARRLRPNMLAPESLYFAAMTTVAAPALAVIRPSCHCLLAVIPCAHTVMTGTVSHLGSHLHVVDPELVAGVEWRVSFACGWLAVLKQHAKVSESARLSLQAPGTLPDCLALCMQALAHLPHGMSSLLGRGAGVGHAVLVRRLPGRCRQHVQQCLTGPRASSRLATPRIQFWLP